MCIKAMYDLPTENNHLCCLISVISMIEFSQAGSAVAYFLSSTADPRQYSWYIFVVFSRSHRLLFRTWWGCAYVKPNDKINCLCNEVIPVRTLFLIIKFFVMQRPTFLSFCFLKRCYIVMEEANFFTI